MILKFLFQIAHRMEIPSSFYFNSALGFCWFFIFKTVVCLGLCSMAEGFLLLQYILWLKITPGVYLFVCS